ncbi:hypothetical protein FHT07_001674 [Xanthomonas arboricola]|nr:hypothetical protein [Xanthomonas arboricola]
MTREGVAPLEVGCGHDTHSPQEGDMELLERDLQRQLLTRLAAHYPKQIHISQLELPR